MAIKVSAVLFLRRTFDLIIMFIYDIFSDC